MCRLKDENTGMPNNIISLTFYIKQLFVDTVMKTKKLVSGHQVAIMIQKISKTNNNRIDDT